MNSLYVLGVPTKINIYTLIHWDWKLDSHAVLGMLWVMQHRVLIIFIGY